MRDEAIVNEIKRILLMEEERVNSLYQHAQQSKINTENGMRELANQIYLQNQGNRELAEATGQDRQQLKTEIMNAWSEIQDNVFSAQLQVRTEFQTRHSETTSELQNARDQLFNRIKNNEARYIEKTEEQDLMVKGLKQSLKGQN